MQFLMQQKMLTVTLVVLQLFMQVALVMPTPLWAQVLDTDPPRIDFKPVVEGLKGDSQVFSATVSDDLELADVVLHYRLDGESVYQNRTMTPIGSTGIFTTTVKIDDSVDVIQYYIEATDKAGNRTLQGFAFDPIERQLLESQVPAAQLARLEEPAPGLSTGRKILYGVLGLIVVGALASAASGSGSGTGGSSQTVPVTITVRPLP